jgi:two-component system, LytTR family, sensor kinase
MESPSQRESARKGRRFWILAGCFSLIFLETVQNYALRTDVGLSWGWGYALRYALIEFVFWTGMTALIVRWAHTFPPEGEQRGRHIGILLSLTLATLLMHAAYRVPLHRLVYHDSRTASLWRQFPFYLTGNAVSDAWIFWAVVGICQAVRSARRSQEREQELTRAQLEMLKAQLQPHFLFNTMNSISWLMREDVEAADNVMTSLSDLLRTTLSVRGNDEVTLHEELHVLDLYLTIERARFQGRLTVRLNVQSDILDCSVPGLLLQPIVENAVRHGVGRLDGPGIVEISAKREGVELHLSVLDNGPGISDEVSQREGIGMANTRARLEKYYGAAHSFDYNNRPNGGLSVDIRIPFRLSRRSQEGHEKVALRTLPTNYEFFPETRI